MDTAREQLDHGYRKENIMFMLQPKRIFNSVVTELAEGLANGTVTVERNVAPTAQMSFRADRAIPVRFTRGAERSDEGVKGHLTDSSLVTVEPKT